MESSGNESPVQHGFSGFQAVPPEILAQILDHTISVPTVIEEYAHEKDVVMTKADPPWPFLLVCKHWHEVVMSTPTLWSNIVLVLNSFYEVDFVRLSSVIDAHLDRSQEAPLTLALFLFDDYFADRQSCDPEEVGPVHKLLEKLMPTQHRWKTVALHAHVIDYPHDPHLNPPIPKDFSICLRDMKDLVKLEFEINVLFYSSQLSINMRPVDIELASCAHLQTIKLVDGVSVKEAPAEVCLAGLRHISIRIQVDQRAMGWWNLLQHSPNVEHLEIRCFGKPPRHSVPLINLPNLRILEMSGAHVVHVLQWLTLPPSVELTVSWIGVELCDEQIAALSRSLKLNKIIVKSIIFVLAHDHVPSYREEVLRDLFSCFGGTRLIKFFSVLEVSYGKLCVSLASAVSTSNHDTNLGPLLPTLESVELEICLSEPTRMIDTIPIRQLIFACKETYALFKFDFRLSFREFGLPNPEVRKEIATEILTDKEIQLRNVSFTLAVDGAELGG